MTRLHDAERDDIKKAIRSELVSTALQHHLVSKYTSLVAVDVTPARQRTDLLKQHAMQTNLPRGWSYDHVFGIPQTATDAQLRLLTGLPLLLLALIGCHVLRRQAC